MVKEVLAKVSAVSSKDETISLLIERTKDLDAHIAILTQERDALNRWKAEAVHAASEFRRTSVPEDCDVLIGHILDDGEPGR